MGDRPDDLDLALERHGLAPGDVGRLFTAAAALSLLMSGETS